MASKRNAALEALGAVAPPPVPAPVVPEPEPLPPVKPAKAVAKVMVYMPSKVARKFKEIAFIEDRKANDIYLEALDLYLTKQGHGGLDGVTGR
jgi:hypothetical protein